MEIQWSLLLFSALAGAGGSLLALTGAAELMGKAPKGKKTNLIVVLVLVIAGGLFSVLHLEQKANIMAAAANVFSFSAISMELIFVGLVAVMAIVYLVCTAREVAEATVKAVAVIGIVVGLLLGYVTGSGYQMGAMPYWDTPALPLAYLGTDLALGAALYGLLALAAKDNAQGALPAQFAVVGAALSLVLCLAYGATSGFALEPVLFWLGVIVLGGVANTAVAAVALKQPSNMALYGAAVVFACIASVCLRAYMWALGTGTLDLFGAAAGHLVL